jgi:signal transduction protein with GAF and PtsI domain
MLIPRFGAAVPNEVFHVLREIIETVTTTLELPAVLQRIVDLVSEVTAADSCLLYLLDESTRMLELQASKPAHPDSIGRIRLDLGEGLTGWVAKEQRPLMISHSAFTDPRFKPFTQLPEDRFEAFLSVPIMLRGRLVGVINVQHRLPRPHTPETVSLVEVVGQLVGGAIANAQLYDAAQQRQRQLESLAKVSDALVSTAYLDTLLELIVTETASLLRSKICSLMLLDEAKQTLTIAATQSLSPAYRNKPPIPVAQSLSGQVVRERRPIAVLDVTTADAYFHRELAAREGLKSLLSVPMLVKDRAVGVLNLYTGVEHAFTPQEIRLLSTLANQAAVAIEHARLVEQSVAMRQTLEDRKVVERAKGILMKEFGLSEEAAFATLRKQSMERRLSMRQLADAIVLSRELPRTGAP